MLICHLYPFFPPYTIGGVEKWILGLSQFLSESSDMRFMLLTDRSNFSFYVTSTKMSKYGTLEVYRLGPNLFSFIFYSSRIKWQIVERLSLMELFHEAVNFLRIKDVDIFHLHGIWLRKEYKQYAELALLLSRFFNKPLMVSLHGYVASKSKDTGMTLFHPEIKKTLKCAKAITTYSYQVLEVLNELGLKSMSYLVPNFIDIRKFTCPTPRDYCSATRIIFISRLDPEKDPITIIRALKQVKEKFPIVKLTVVGYGSMYKEIRNMILKLGLEGNVTLVGRHADVRKFLWNNDILISAGYLTSLEAWAAGLPVICDDKVAVPGACGDENLLLFRSHDSADLAQKISTLIEDEQLRKKLAMNGLRTVENYDIRKIARKIKDLYEKVTEN